MLRFYKSSPLHEGRIGIFPGAFNPPTKAHLALARAAREQHDLAQIVFLLPEQFPHKLYTGASFDDRLAMLRDACGADPGLAIASSEHGLFIDIARAFRAGGPRLEICLLCGKDAAERIVHWDYTGAPSFAEQLEEFRLLVASRQGEYQAPATLEDKMGLITLPAAWDEVSSSAVREAIAAGRPWRHWVEDAVAQRIEQRGLYG
jgi:nicotinate-nucleotide adenylyltransferase